MIKKILLTITLTVFGMSAFTGPAFAAASMAGANASGLVAVDDEEVAAFTVVNETGFDIGSLYIDAAGEEEWGEDLLGEQGILRAGESWELNFEPEAGDEDAALYDLAIRWDGRDGTGEDDFVVWEDIDLDGAEKLTLLYDEESDKTSFELE